MHLYEELRRGAASHELRGMFAFALWDERRRRLLLARDRLGIKPLYYRAATTDALVFASEIKALLRAPGCTRGLDLDGARQLPLAQYVPAPRRCSPASSTLPPGHLLVADDARRPDSRSSGTCRSHGARPSTATNGDARAELRALLRGVGAPATGQRRAGRRLPQRRPRFSAVVALMRRELRPAGADVLGRLRRPGEGDSELPYARQVAEHFGHRAPRGDRRHPRPGRPAPQDVVWHPDEPFADIALLPTYLVAELAAQHVKVVLTGEGGDELFAGYRALRGGTRLRHFPGDPEAPVPAEFGAEPAAARPLRRLGSPSTRSARPTN